MHDNDLTPTDPTSPDLTSSISTQTDDAPAIRERQEPTTAASQADTITAGMEVIAADGAHIGTVDTVDGDEIRLARGDGDDDHRLLPVSLVDVVADGRVTMRGRGDNAFGVEA